MASLPKDLYGGKAIWSPNSESFVLDFGTSVVRRGYVYSIPSHCVSETISYVGKILWLDSENFVYARENKDMVIESCEICSTDIIIDNVKTGECKSIFEGTLEYYYLVKEIDGDNITCTKNYFGQDEKVQLERYKDNDAKKFEEKVEQGEAKQNLGDTVDELVLNFKEAKQFSEEGKIEQWMHFVFKSSGQEDEVQVIAKLRSLCGICFLISKQHYVLRNNSYF